MVQYKYSVLDSNNNIIKGELEANSENEARELLFADGKKIISLQADMLSNGMLMDMGPQKLTSDEIAMFCKQLHIICKSGISIIKGLIMIKTQTESKKVQKLCDNIYTKIQKGASISSAFKNSGFKLPVILVNMIEIGELSGNLDEIFKKMSDYFERDAKTKKKISSSMVYPIILVVIAIGVMSLFSFKVLPEMVSMMKDSNAKIPFITQFLLDSSNAIKDNLLYILFGIILLAIGYAKVLPHDAKVKISNYFILKFPGIRTVSKDLLTARFLRTMGILVKTGLSMMVILETVENTMGNETLRKALSEAKDKVNKGDSLTSSIESIGFFDNMVINIISIGEETGTLDTSLLDLADYYDEKFDAGISKLVAFIEPLFTIIMGIVVGGLILSVMLPMFNMIGTMNAQ